MRIKHLAFLALVLLAACAPVPPVQQTPVPPTPTPTPAAAVLDPRPVTARNCLARGAFPPLVPGQQAGVNLFLFGTDDQRVLTLAKAADFTWVRQQIHWKDLEGERGRFTWAGLDHIVDETTGRGFRLMLSVVRSPRWATASGAGGLPADPAPFGQFMRTLAERYEGRVAAYEIWNEPNLALENGGTPATPELYLPVLQAGFRGVKEADPCALVLAAPLAATASQDPSLAANDLQFYERLYELDGGAFLHAADAVAVHPGGGPHPPEARWPADVPEQSAFYFRHIERIRELMERYGDRRQVWITEVGWTVSRVQGAPEPVSPEQQGRYLVDMLRLTRERYPWVAAVLVWNLNFSVLGPATDEKATFGILNPDWSPRPAYTALQQELGDRRRAEERAAPRITVLDGGRSLPWYAWSFAGSGKMRARPLLAPDGTLYLVSDPGHLYALAPSGALRWSYDTAGETRDAPALGPDGTLYLADGSGTLTALASGEYGQPADGGRSRGVRPHMAASNSMVRWTTALPAAPRGSPAILGDGVAITAGSRVVLFDRAGREGWRRDLGSELSPVAATSDGGLLVGSAGGDLVKLSAAGEVIWRTALGGPIGKTPAPTPDGGAYALVGGTTLAAIDGAGREVWRSPLSAESAAAPLALPAAVAATARDGTLALFDGASGQPRWRASLGSDLVATPSFADGLLFVGSDDGRLIALDLAGTTRWQAILAGMARSQPAVGPDGVIYITTTGGRVYAIESR